MDDDMVYIPFIIKMANTKIERCRGTQLRKLRNLIEAAQRADDAQMSIWPPATDNSAWCAANDAACAAGCALREFADPI